MLDSSIRKLLNQAKIEVDLSSFRAGLPPEFFTKFACASEYPEKALIFTSFDGDNMHYLDWMCYVAHELGFVPVNAEAALGYYLSTTSHNGIKTEVMRDCIALELACQELWIFDSVSANDAAHLAEGIIAEFVLWHQIRPERPVRYFPWLTTPALSEHRTLLSAQPHDELLETLEFSFDYQSQLIVDMDHAAIHEMEEKLLRSVKEHQIRPLAFISQDFHDLKHIDWARALAYQSGYVPFSPETLLNHFVMNMAYGERMPNEYARDRIALLAAAQELWIFAKPGVSVFSGLGLPEQTRFDLYYWLTCKPASVVRLFYWQDVGVPKFDPDSFWALTTSEQLENFNGKRTRDGGVLSVVQSRP